MRLKSVVACALMSLMAMPAMAYKLGYEYVDGSDSILGSLPQAKVLFEAAIARELEFRGGQDAETAPVEIKGLKYPLLADGKQRRNHLCGWVKGVGETTGNEFLPFYYLKNALHARIVDLDDENQRGMLRDNGCAEQLGL